MRFKEEPPGNLRSQFPRLAPEHRSVSEEAPSNDSFSDAVRYNQIEMLRRVTDMAS